MNRGDHPVPSPDSSSFYAHPDQSFLRLLIVRVVPHQPCRTTHLYQAPSLRNNITPFHGAVRKIFWCILPSKCAPGAHQASRGGGRGQCPPKPSFGHATAVLSALTPKVKRPRFKLPPRPECPFKSTRKCRRALAWLRAPRTPAAPPELDFCAVAVTFCAAPRAPRAQFSCRPGAMALF